MSVRKSSQDLEPTVPSDITVEPISSSNVVQEKKSNLKKALSHIKLKYKSDPVILVFNDIPYKPMTYYAFE